jgi:hypothetical protein
MTTLPQPPPPPSDSAGQSKSSPSKVLAAVVIAITFLVGAGIGFAVGNGSQSDSSAAPQVVTVTKTVTEPASGPIGFTFQSGPTGPTATGSSTDSSLSDPFPKGESGEAFGWTVKVVDFNPAANDVVEQANEFNARPRKGTYAIATVRFTRTEGKSSDPYFDMEASLVVRGQTFPESDEACCLPDGWDAIGKVPTGGTGLGRIAFDVPRAGLEDAVLFLVITDPSGFDEAEMFFAVN